MIASLLAGVAHDAASNPSLASTSTDNTVTFSPLLPDADFDGDGDIDGRDFLAWQRGYGIQAPNATKADGDADNDLDVDGDDLAVWQDQYGTPAPLVAQSTAVESGDNITPATMAATFRSDNSWFFLPSTNVGSSIDPVLAEVAIDQALVDGGLADPIVAADSVNLDDLFTVTRDADTETYDGAFATWDSLELAI